MGGPATVARIMWEMRLCLLCAPALEKTTASVQRTSGLRHHRKPRCLHSRVPGAPAVWVQGSVSSWPDLQGPRLCAEGLQAAGPPPSWATGRGTPKGPQRMHPKERALRGWSEPRRPRFRYMDTRAVSVGPLPTTGSFPGLGGWGEPARRASYLVGWLVS